MRDITTFLTEIVLQNNTINNNTQTYQVTWLKWTYPVKTQNAKTHSRKCIENLGLYKTHKEINQYFKNYQ